MASEYGAQGRRNDFISHDLPKESVRRRNLRRRSDREQEREMKEDDAFEAPRGNAAHCHGSSYGPWAAGGRFASPL